MKKIILLLLTVSSVLFTACSKDDIGEGQLSEIGLEKTEIKATSEGASFTVKTKTAGWDICRTASLVDSKETVTNNAFYIKDINGDKVNTYHEKMSGEWFEVAKSGEKEVTIKVSNNNTGKERKLTVTITGVSLQEGNLTIIQK